jgi:hypothetical protein
MTDHTKPIPSDERFTFGLVLDVAQVIERHGYPPIGGSQALELQAHLFHFLHGHPDHMDDR